MDPKSPDVLYAGMWEVFRTPHSLSSGGPGSGLFKTTDGGSDLDRARRRTPACPSRCGARSASAFQAPTPIALYALIEAQDGGLYLSDDAGATWKLANDNRNIRQRAFYYTRVYADPQAKDTVYILNVSMYRSTDAGKTLAASACRTATTTICGSRPNDPQAAWPRANDGGANISLNAGQSWTDQDFPTAQFYNVFTTAHVPYHVCGAQQDNSTACVPSTGGELYAVGGGESGYIAPDPEDTDVFYAGSYGGLLTRINRRTGERRSINVWPDNPMGHSASDMTERFQWTFPIVIAPTNPNVALRHLAARLAVDQRRAELGRRSAPT